MIEVESISFQRFMSFGDEMTTLKLSNLGAVLVVGRIDTGTAEDNQEDDYCKRSNGAGKSALTNALAWSIFGRTMHTAEPGDDVVNWILGGECIASATLKNGDTICRRRVKGGKTDLTVTGTNESMFSARSTTDNQQLQLAKTYSLDWGVFCGSVFCAQYGKPWLDLSDTARKQIIERLLHTDRYTCYAAVAKEKLTKIEQDQTSIKNRYEMLVREEGQLTADIGEAEEEEKEFEASRAQRYRNALAEAERILDQVKAIVPIDAVKLAAKWKIIDQVTAVWNDLVKTQSALTVESHSLSRNIQELTANIEEWKSKGGRVCLECGQDVAVDHVQSKVEPFLAAKAARQAELAKVKAKIAKIGEQIKEIEEEVATRRPEHTLREAKIIADQIIQLKRSSKSAKDAADAIEAQKNPQTAMIAKLKDRLEKTRQEIAALSSTVKQHDLVYRHFNYIYRKYSDRRYAKSVIVGQYLPFFNGRMRHYLDKFNLDFEVELTDSLAIKTDKWKPAWMSGGERNSINLSFMFSMYDLHEELYGRQCNVMVLDEVDSKLDEANVVMFADIVENELAHKVETVLVISHRNLLRDLLPRQIVVRRDQNRISSVVEVR